MARKFCGDARRCPHHPNVKVSSDDGLFDGLCGPCEALQEEAREEESFKEEAARLGLTPEAYRSQIALAKEVLREAASSDDDLPF